MYPRAMLSIAALLIISLGGGALSIWQWASTMPELRDFADPARTTWKPVGPRFAGTYGYDVIPMPNAFHTMHVGLDNTDEIWTAVAPMVTFDWVAETAMYVPEGPTFDDAGNLYFSPYNPQEDVSLVSLEWETGKRRWAIPGRGPGNGAILILNDPDRPGQQAIYHSTYSTGMALRQDGTPIWESPTGLTTAEVPRPMMNDAHVWGLNYHPPGDAIIGVTMNGLVYAFDRRSGQALLDTPLALPSAPAATARLVPAWLARAGDAETDLVFGRDLDGKGVFTGITEVIFGSGVIVANFFGIHPDSGRIYIAATASDEQDGHVDGEAENGALYMLELHPPSLDSDGWQLAIEAVYFFEGGTGSTPTIRSDGERVAVSDDNGNLIMLDAHLNEIWRIDVGHQIAASIAVSSDNRELYAVTKFDVTKVIDHGDSGEIAWKATLDAYPGFDNFNALTPTIAANGIAITVGAGRQLGDNHLMMKVGAALLDRETGQLRHFSEGREESIAVTSIGPDGGYYLASSPVRRAATRGLLGDVVPPIVGGIQRHKPVRFDLLARDALCAAAHRIENTRSFAPSHPEATRLDLLQTSVLLTQTRFALDQGVEEGSIPATLAEQVAGGLDTAQMHVEAHALDALGKQLVTGCAQLD